MPSGVFEITDIPEDRLATVVADFLLDSPPPEIRTTKQQGGRWTVVATFPGPGKHKKTFKDD